ncbi:6-carboxytetrahydropterin synthase [Neorhizobium sp. BETTINA12A]|uniref:6-pyruvoyl trahydropterin synthase family protein n=1 Tax=unclassified Neorhizobium TaxID=2629175 RepID=UPI001FF1A25F|nr:MULTISPECIES: 6-carboxytetrahydropterin synthase [unclassified Neorhizobium]MCJ9673864.1 6-carboxytetrahydropterin synthase [Neorhizobium sp. SHOUNA12B]MCJ9744381.1 6-carboxytetrahydropterin synthase [Neorhizobium sp. SHOUNA12A]MCJ9754139.1 6-carboxytetrahydropterin synthase [Neorhizobium sp. BETTINA12A]
MFAVEVRDHIMIAHSLPRPVFGPAQGMHGATFVVDAAFFTSDLDENGLAVDIGLASEVLKDVLAPLNYQNLDTLEIFAGKVTTTEFLAKHIFDRIADAIRNGRLGEGGARIRKLRVMLHESHTARGWFEAEL